jgi:hypothetical protein
MWHKIFLITSIVLKRAREHLYYTAKLIRSMKANRILLVIIAAVAIFATPSVLTSPVLAQTDTGTQGTTDDESQIGNQGTTGGGGGARGMYEEFQTCLQNEQGTGGTTGSVSEEDIRACFTDAGYIPGIDDDNEDQEGIDDDNEDQEENEDNEDETNN